MRKLLIDRAVGKHKVNRTHGRSRTEKKCKWYKIAVYCRIVIFLNLWYSKTKGRDVYEDPCNVGFSFRAAVYAAVH